MDEILTCGHTAEAGYSFASFQFARPAMHYRYWYSSLSFLFLSVSLFLFRSFLVWFLDVTLSLSLSLCLPPPLSLFRLLLVSFIFFSVAYVSRGSSKCFPVSMLTSSIYLLWRYADVSRMIPVGIFCCPYAVKIKVVIAAATQRNHLKYKCAQG